MADEADIAYHAEQYHLNKALADQKAKSASVAPIGVCHFCEASLAGSLLFCDVDCRHDWDRQNRARRLNGHAGLDLAAQAIPA